MKIRKLVIENYKSFKNSTEIQFPDNQHGKSIFLIGGMNGAGKTSVMEAINYCLYGIKNEDVFSLINRKEKAIGNTSVSFELALEEDDGAIIEIKRSWTAGNIVNPKPKDLKERLIVEKNGKMVSSENKEIGQEYIRASIPPGITKFFFFDGEKIQDIAADDHFEVKLQKSLEAALGIQYVNTLAEDLNNLKKEERKSYIETDDAILDLKASELKQAESKLQKKQSEREEIKAELTSLSEEKEAAKKQFSATFNQKPESKEEIRKKEKNRIELSKHLGKIEDDIHSLCESSLPLALTSKLFADIRSQIEKEGDNRSSEAIRMHAAELTNKIIGVIDDPEPLFQEKLALDKLQKLEKRIETLLNGFNATNINKILGLSERDSARVLNQMEAIEQSDVLLIPGWIEQKKELEAQLEDISFYVNRSSASEGEQELFEKLQNAINDCSAQIGRKKEQLSVIENELSAIEKQIKILEKNLDLLYDKHSQSQEKNKLLKECDDVSSVLKEFVVKLRKNKIHLLQEKTFEMYKQLSSKADLIKDISIDDNTYEIKIIDSSGQEITKSKLSAGEKEVFAVSLLWGLAQTSQLKLPIIIDTPLSRLDSTHRDNIVNYYFPNAGEQIIILSTDTEIDTNYYRDLKVHLAGAAKLEFDHAHELTTVKSGYFWEE